MKRILEYEFAGDLRDAVRIKMPRGAQLLNCFGDGPTDAAVLALVDPNEPTIGRTFQAFETDVPVDAGLLVERYVGELGDWHLFEVG